jgi:hypothetical protein
MSNVANPAAGKNQEHSGLGATAAKEAENAAGYLSEKANQAGQFVADQANKAATAALNSAENAGTFVGQKADDARHAMGSGIKSMGESLKSAAPEGMMHDATFSVAQSLESTGRYLEEHGLSAMTEDLTNVIKRNPIPSVFIAAGIGFLLAKACTSSRSSNY